MDAISLSDEALTKAAASVRRSMLDSLPPPSRCEHEFSDLFQAKMRRLLDRYDLRRRARAAVRRVAVVFLALLFSAGTWLGVDAEARAAFSAWARELYEEHIIYRFFGAPAADTLPAYRITWLPKGYEQVDLNSSDKAYNVFYQSGNDAMSSFAFDYRFVQSGMVTVILDSEHSQNHKTVEVNGIQADFYESVLPNETNNLIWVDEEAGIVFELNGFLDEAVMLHIARSVVLEDYTK